MQIEKTDCAYERFAECHFDWKLLSMGNFNVSNFFQFFFFNNPIGIKCRKVTMPYETVLKKGKRLFI